MPQDPKPGMEQSLSQRQLQYLRLLGMDCAALEDYLGQLQLENPMLQLDPPAQEELFMPASKEEPSGEDSGEEPSPDWRERTENLNEERVSLYAHLKSQLDMSLTGIEEGLMELVLASLDENGYLSCDEEELAALAGAPCEAVREAADYLRSLDPPGVGAKDLPECLCLQLQRQGVRQALPYTLAREHLVGLSQGRFSKIARQLGVTLQQVREGYALLRRLDPRPGASFGREAAQYIQPDVIVEQGKEGLFVRMNGGRLPTPAISPEYRALLERGEAKEYLQKKLAQANWVIEAVRRRQETIEAVGRVILSRQRAFFEDPQGALRPLGLEAVAAELGVHPSTVSRAMGGKYLCCKRGTFPLKYFLCTKMPGASEREPPGGEESAPSSDAVRRRIAELVRGEDPKAPLSDAQLCALLEREGLSVARRTVAKYRGQLGLSSAAQRAIR